MSEWKRKKIIPLFSSSKKPKRWKSDGTEEFSVKQALRDRGSYYNQDERGFCPSVFHLQAVSTQNTGLQGSLAGPHACSTLIFPFVAFWGMVIKYFWKSKRCEVEQHNTNSADKIFCVKEITAVYIQIFSKLWYFVLQTITLLWLTDPFRHLSMRRGF